MDYVVKVECVDISKKQQSANKQINLYHLQVTWCNKTITRVGRPYTEFFDYRKSLQKAAENRKDVIIPDLPGIKQFEKGIFGTKDSKKKKTIEEFCQTILKLPEDLSRSSKVTDFFRPTKTIELKPDTLQHLSGIPSEMSEIIQQLRSHSHTDNKPGAVKPPNPSIQVSGPAGGPQPQLQRAVSEDPQASVYTASTNYRKQRDNEVDLQAGAKVDVLQKDLTGWWFVHVEDTEEQGWAPGSLLEASSPTLDTNIPPQGKDGSNLYMATKSHKAENADEVSYEAGDLAEVIEFKMDGWWKVRHKGREGMMPAIHLEPVTKEKGQTRKIASSLYHHNSIYSKSSPPPRRSTRISELYSKVSKPSNKNLTYADIEFDSNPATGKARPIIIRGDSERTQYTDVLPISLPAKDSDKLEQPSAPNGDTRKSGRPSSGGSDSRSHNYMNWKTPSTPTPSGYMNVTINKGEQPSMEINVFEVIADHDSRSMQNERLRVRRGDYVQADKVEAHRALCYLLDDDESTPSVKGWIPLDKLKSSYTAASPAPGLLCPDSLDIEMPPEPSLPSPIPPSDGKSAPWDDPSPESVIVQAMWDSPSQQDGFLAFKKGDKAKLLCKNNKGWWGVLSETQRGWVPSAYWEISEVKKMVPPKSPDPPPKSPSGSIGSQGPNKQRHHEAHLNQRWFVGKMSRTECEDLFAGHAKETDFVVRESTYRIGHFTLSVQYDNRLRHFPIILTDDEKYYIGKHNFRNLCHIVTYYQKNPLFYNDDEEPVSLGSPLIISEC